MHWVVTSNTCLSSSEIRSVIRTRAAPGVLVHDESSRASKTGLGVRIPDSRGITRNTVVLIVQVWSSMRAITSVSVRIKGKSSWASDTSISVRIPHSWCIAANTIVACIDMGQSSWADTRVPIIDVIGWANITRLSVSIPP